MLWSFNSVITSCSLSLNVFIFQEANRRTFLNSYIRNEGSENHESVTAEVADELIAENPLANRYIGAESERGERHQREGTASIVDNEDLTLLFNKNGLEKTSKKGHRNVTCNIS